MDRDQEPKTEAVGMPREIEQQSHAGAEEERSRVSFAPIQIETASGRRIAKLAVINCDLDQSQMTEAGVRELGFSLETRKGRKMRKIKLKLGAPGEPHSFAVGFKIIAEADHDITLDEAAADRLHESARGTNFLVFAAPVSEKTRQKRAQDRKDRLEREKQATEEKLKDALKRKQAAMPKPATVARL